MALPGTPHILILGGGPAGYAAASAAASWGANATIVERERVGGACTLWDAIPSKTLLDAADALHNLEHAAAVGIVVGEPGARPSLDFARMLQRVREVADHQCAGVAARLTQAGVRVVTGEGEIVDERTLLVRRGAGETTVAFDMLVVATGARPWAPAFVPLDHPRVLTTRSMWELDELPEHLVVVGAGPTGCELADFFQRCGTQVTLVSSRDRILPTEDADVAWVLEDALLARGVRIHHRSRAHGIDARPDGVAVHVDEGVTFEASHALFAVGMQPNTAGLGLERLGVELGARGALTVDDYCCTNHARVYGAGDVTAGLMLANVAAMQGRHAVAHALGEPVEPIRFEAVASTVFTRPEIADVGLTEQRAAEQERAVLAISQPLANNPRAVISGATEGLVKLVVDPETGVVLGGSIVGMRASELISTVALAVRAGLTVHELAETGTVNPSVSESLQRAAERASARLAPTHGPGRVSSVTLG